MADLNPGELVDGYYYQGGDKSDPNSYLKQGQIVQDHSFKGGLASDKNNWEPIEELNKKPGYDLNEDQQNTVQRNALLKMMGYPINLLTTGLAGEASAVKNMYQHPEQSAWQNIVENNVVKPEEMKNALNPFRPNNPPNAGEYLNRLNIPSGGAVSDVVPNSFSEPGSGGLLRGHLPEKGGPLDWTLRGTATGLGQAILDPMNAVFPKPVGATTEAAGNSLYRSAFKAPDFQAVKEGAAPLSSFFMENRPWMNTGDMAVASQKLGQQGMAGMRSAVREGAERGAANLSQEEALGPALDTANKLMENSHTYASGAKLRQEVLDRWGQGHEIPLEAGRDISITAGKAANWADKAKDLPRNEVLKAERHGAEGGVVNSLENLDPDLANKYLNYKSAARTSIATEPYLKNEVGKAIRKNNMTEVKGALLGHALETAKRPEGFFPLAAMYAAKAFNSPSGRTGVGNVLTGAGRLGQSSYLPVDALIRQGLIMPPNSAWLKQNNEEEQ